MPQPDSPRSDRAPFHRLGRAIAGIPRRRAERYAPPFLWAALIFFLSSLPGNAYPEVPVPNADKFVHAMLYFPLGFWLARAASASPAKSSLKRLTAAVAIGVLYGISDECHQLFVPLRTFSLMDWATDCVAVLAGTLAWSWWLRRCAGTAACPHLSDETAK
jgi:VanZ family protein